MMMLEGHTWLMNSSPMVTWNGTRRARARSEITMMMRRADLALFAHAPRPTWAHLWSPCGLSRLMELYAPVLYAHIRKGGRNYMYVL
jgi:hypothetical protein